MPTDVVMPQMGESIAEGTIVRWIKQIGDKVERDEPLFEISTDKVDAEIPSPAAGVVAEIRHKEGETVPVNTVVAIIAPAAAGAADGAPAAARQASTAGPSEAVSARQPEKPATTPPARAAAAPPPAPRQQGDGSSAPASTVPASAATPEAASARPASGAGPKHAQDSIEEVIRQRSSPLVRRIAKEHNVDISQLRGTGIAGRVTKDDILAFIGSGSAPAAPTAARESASAPSPQAASPRTAQPQAAAKPASPLPGQTVAMSVMRKKIAEHMITSRRTSAHVHSVFEVNFHRVAQIREAKKAEYERAGAKLTYLSFILKAAIDALRAVPVVNSSIDGDNIVYHKTINVGIAVALDWGLIVPVVKNADEKNLLGLSRAVSDLASRARSKQLKPDEVGGGTFTITNPGVFGALFGMPIINQPQVAILGVGAVEKRPVVVDDAIAIRAMAYLSLGYDHRIIDGAVADEFMSHVKRTLENWDPNDA
jgi:2-oxoglutarate dehydrogenase E2 component (dihydrolipoamide succinyltransferase)